MNKLGVSVIIPTYNRATFILRAVLSALAAIMAGDEIIVCDDGSRDKTRAVIAPYMDRVRYLPLEHAGAGKTRNAGIAQACNPLVAFLDSDDEWSPVHLSLHRELLSNNPQIVFSFSNFNVKSADRPLRSSFLKTWQANPRSWEEWIGPGQSYAEMVPGAGERFPVHCGNLYLAEMLSDLVPTFTLVARRNAIDHPRWFAEDVPVFEDWQCFGLLASRGPCAFLDRDTATQHGHREGRLTDESDLAKLTARLTILERLWGRDQPFLAGHMREYQQFLRTTQILRARCLLSMNRVVEAREALCAIERAPWRYRLLAGLPQPVTSTLVRTWRSMRSRTDVVELPEKRNEKSLS